MSDRQVSIRLGKGFWSRGPAPLTIRNFPEFPTLEAQKIGSDNLALFFQAHIELTQLFSNTHDILYSSTSHREQLYMGGEYIRYIVSCLSRLHTVICLTRCPGRLHIRPAQVETSMGQPQL